MINNLTEASAQRRVGRSTRRLRSDPSRVRGPERHRGARPRLHPNIAGADASASSHRAPARSSSPWPSAIHGSSS